MSSSQKTFQIFIRPQQERTYFELPFSVPENVCRMDLSYTYQRYEPEADPGPGSPPPREVNIIDLALRDSTGNFIGASGAGRSQIHISATDSSAGYAKTAPLPGSWAVIVGAYKVAPAGVLVSYSVTFTFRERTLLKGDPHVHSNASDGAFSREQLLAESKKIGLDFFFLTDHNNYAHNSPPDGIRPRLSLPRVGMDAL